MFSKITFKIILNFTVIACVVAQDMQVMEAEMKIEKNDNSQIEINANIIAFIPTNVNSEIEYCLFYNVHNSK